MPEGDTLQRAAQQLRPLVGQRLAAESPHPRAAALGIAARIDGRRLDAVEAIGKNLVLRFEGGVVLRSHLRMTGRWQVVSRGTPLRGRPWLVLRGDRLEARQFNGPVLELSDAATRRLGPDVLAPDAEPATLAARLRLTGSGVAVGEALLDQRAIAGVGNMWRAEALWEAAISPWARLGVLDDVALERVCAAVVRLMRGALAGGRPRSSVYRRAGRPCPRCGTVIRSYPQGDDARRAYWCPGCQGPPEAGAGPSGAYL